ncbi:DNA-binding transcriptional regulator, GntR family [Thermomonospora echinospora]|uniref:DNA-binding transcriptional regulator, GntR family n=1 Tax=Thermomonospora echinospora TaxID=1992 RepID=A0A1H6DN03_9ACTN|nr:GntR family transcriptional regulator [Thermomonospora echinospora]SEG86604.1 DNA-binding transcriptional regulator, GntR family [Thermomonospora echinospora]
MPAGQRATDTAYEAVRQMILSGEAAPGTRLGEAELAEMLGLSRTPVREALQRLGADGLVEVLPHRGARVVLWTAADLEEIFELRTLLEPYAAARAARIGLEEPVLIELRGLCAAMERAAAERELARLAQLNSRFHAALIDASGNQRLPAMLTSVMHAPLILGTFHRYDAETMARSMAHHREVVDAIAARDPEWAASVMRSHLRAAAANLKEDQ